MFRFKRKNSWGIYKWISLLSLWGMRHMQQVSHHMLIFLTLLPETIAMKLLGKISRTKGTILTTGKYHLMIAWLASSGEKTPPISLLCILQTTIAFTCMQNRKPIKATRYLHAIPKKITKKILSISIIVLIRVCTVTPPALEPILSWN